MSTELGIESLTRAAGADLSAKQYRFVKQANTGAVSACSVAGEQALGVLQNNPTSGKNAEVAYEGLTKVVLGGTVAIADLVSTDTAGRAVTASSGVVLGECIKGGSVGEIGTILLRSAAASGTVYSFPSNPTDVQSATVTIATAAVKTLNATPVELVPAPGAGYANVLIGALAFLDYNSAAYDGVASGEDLAIKYTDGSGLQVAAFETTGFLDQTSDQIRYVAPTVQTSNAGQTIVANAALVAHMLTGEIATGNSPVKIRCYYRVVPTTL